jgi:RHS repeat-associated protein
MPQCAWDRLVKVQDDQQTPATVAEYRYDGTNRRIRKYTDKSGDDWTVREFYYNASWQALEVSKDTKARVGGVEPDLAAPAYEQYVWSARYIDAPVLRDRDNDQDPDLEERLYYTTDANMNVTALVGTDGDVVERYMYDPYGRLTILNGASGVDKDGAVTEWTADTNQTASDVDNAVLYCGYYHDCETGLYCVRHRYYDPPLGRWLARDPRTYINGMNLQEYVGGRVGTMSDPSGANAEQQTGGSGGSPQSRRLPQLPRIHEGSDSEVCEWAVSVYQAKNPGKPTCGCSVERGGKARLYKVGWQPTSEWQPVEDPNLARDAGELRDQGLEILGDAGVQWDVDGSGAKLWERNIAVVWQRAKRGKANVGVKTFLAHIYDWVFGEFVHYGTWSITFFFEAASPVESYERQSTSTFYNSRKHQVPEPRFHPSDITGQWQLEEY